MLVAEPILIAMLAIFLFAVLCGALVLCIVSLRKPMTLPLVIAGGLVLLALVVVVLSPVKIPTLMGMILAVLGIAVAIVGGDPITRRVLDIAGGSRVRETEDGGILILEEGADDADAARPLMRGGTVIGYLERIAVVVAIIVGYPSAIAVVVAVKGIGRFSELAASEARERFIVGTLASLLWACVVGGLVRLAMF